MKSLSYIATISCIALALTATAAAQDRPGAEASGKEKRETIPARQNDGGDAAPAFVDEDGDGINDNQHNQRGTENAQQQVRQRRRDHFIDVDGDGINDERCDGVGVRGGQRRGQQKGDGGQ